MFFQHCRINSAKIPGFFVRAAPRSRLCHWFLLPGTDQYKIQDANVQDLRANFSLQLLSTKVLQLWDIFQDYVKTRLLCLPNSWYTSHCTEGICYLRVVMEVLMNTPEAFRSILEQGVVVFFHFSSFSACLLPPTKNKEGKSNKLSKL